MSKKISKEDLKSPDQVTKALREGFVWTTSHSQFIVMTIAAFILIGGGYSVYSYFAEKKEITMQEKYFGIEKKYTEAKRGFDDVVRAEAAAAGNKDKTKKTPAVDISKKATGDLEKDYGAVVADFETLIAEASGAKAGQMSALNVAEIYLSYGKTDLAIAALEKVSKGLSSSGAISSLVWMQLGNAYANKNDCKIAIEKWQNIVSSKGLMFAHGEAKLRQGLCFESLNDSAKAEQMYSEVATKDAAADTASAREAQRYLRLLKAKKNL